MLHDTGLDVSGLSHDWSVAQALAEILQNTLDEGRKESNVSYFYDDESSRACFRDNGAGIGRECWAFGHSDKAAGSIGQFGNGMKRALCVLSRENRAIVCETAGYTVKPLIRPYTLSETVNTLWLDITNSPRERGTLWAVECTADEYRQALDSFLETHSTQYTTIHETIASGLTVCAMLPAGAIFLNGAKVDTANSAFSYSLRGEKCREWTNESRKGAMIDKIKEHVFYVYYGNPPENIFSGLFAAYKKSSGIFETELGLYDTSITSAIITTAFRAVFGKRAVSENRYAQTDQHNGWEPVKVPHRWTFDCLKAPANQSASKPAHDLTETEHANLEAAKRIIRRVRSKMPRVHVKESIVLENGTLASGLWSDGRIYLSRSILADRQETLAVLLHEVAHWDSDAGDCTSAHARAIQTIAAELLLK